MVKAGNREQKNREQGVGNREQRTENRELRNKDQGIGNREQGIERRGPGRF